MKVLIVTPHRDLVGGVEVVSQQLELLLKKNNYHVEYLTTDDFYPGPFEKVLIKLIGKQYITMKRFRELKEKPDIVIANGEYALGINHKKLINYYHGSYWALKTKLKTHLTLRSRLMLTWRAFIQEIGLGSRNIVAVSSFLENILINRGARNVKVIQNSIDTNLFSPDSSDKNNELVFVGRFDYWGKGFDILERVCKKGHRLLVVTDSKNFKAPNSSLMYKPDRVLIPGILRQSKILIFPSRFEAFGQVPAEAMACGVPILMRETGLGMELKNSIKEFIVDDFNNMDEVETKIQFILDNYEFFSSRARQYALENFSTDVFERKWLEMLESNIC